MLFAHGTSWTLSYSPDPGRVNSGVPAAASDHVTMPIPDDKHFNVQAGLDSGPGVSAVKLGFLQFGTSEL